MAVEDGAVLAKLFSHLSSDQRISSLLYAFQEVRQPRTRAVYERDAFDLKYLLLPDGPEQAARDARAQAMTLAGKNVLEDAEGNEKATELWETLCRIFGYDCEDEADNWWVQWGMLRERASERDEKSDAEEGKEVPRRQTQTQFDFSGMSATVQVTSVEES